MFLPRDNFVLISDRLAEDFIRENIALIDIATVTLSQHPRCGCAVINEHTTVLFKVRLRLQVKAGARAVNLGEPSVYQGGPKFEIKHKSRCLPKSKLVNWGDQACRLGGPGPPGPSLAPGLLQVAELNQLENCGGGKFKFAQR